jgi:aminoglycoside/choline kinase family phosphotransferase
VRSRPTPGSDQSLFIRTAAASQTLAAIDNGLRARGFSAPSIHHADLDAGFLITEDFGIASFVEGDPPAPVAERYEAATDLLAALHPPAGCPSLPVVSQPRFNLLPDLVH